ncbi:hypothetical protein [Pedobacter cryoconitis]|uniref:hypothetical protein n=1 Tax=Pedobacter cryoconitis TaxID=188932 RepID=UPI001609312B|nr:hypothetical protein [Pedobacter cryoconitis]MBB5646605.1 hypothetical protein [Pedobacter cryoconitis]
MKNIFIFLTAVTFTINTSYAQDNIFSVNGNVGIGIATPGNKLQVKVAKDVNFGVTTGISDPSALLIGAINDANTSLKPLEYRAGYHNFSSGNVGIGIINPGNKLQVKAAADVNFGITTGIADPFALLIGAINDANTSLKPLEYRASYHNFSSGNVGIGIINPGNKLQVKAATDINFGITTGIADPLALLIGAINDANTSLKPLEYRASYHNFSSGNVGIGTTTPDEKLAVNGVIHSKEVRVDLKAWPDYVFKPRYNLLTLNEVKTYVEQNHHLPEMPSAAEVETKGLKLGEINTLLTKKVEELTLYLFEKDAEVTTLKSNFDSLEKKYQDQQNQLHAIKDMLDQLKKGK